MHELIAHNKEVIKKGSKSFALAARFFDHDTYQAIAALYSWCRYCDDLIDNAKSQEQARINLIDLERRTELAFMQRPLDDLPFQALYDVVTKYRIPKKYPLDLLHGFSFDVEQKRFQTIDDLLEYCYGVAGVVGLMMCHIMGCHNPKAFPHAVALGNAMQLTNIARDLFDDAQIGRVYIPESILSEHGMTRENFLHPNNRQKLVSAVDALLSEADHLYAVGKSGFQYLPRRAAYAVSAAAAVYSEIGRLVRQRQTVAWEKRTYVPLWRKLWLSLFAILSVRMKNEIRH